jgi:hypothetical protein
MIEEDQGFAYAPVLPRSPVSGHSTSIYESLLSSLSLQEEVASAPQTHDMSRGLEDASTASEAQ